MHRGRAFLTHSQLLWAEHPSSQPSWTLYTHLRRGLLVHVLAALLDEGALLIKIR